MIMEKLREVSAASRGEQIAKTNKSTSYPQLPAEELAFHIERCVSNNRESQEILYKYFFAYAISICNRYTNNRNDSIEILNDAFLKCFRAMDRYIPSFPDVEGSFKRWLRQIMINTSLDFLRREQKQRYIVPLEEQATWVPSKEEGAIEKISYKELLESIQQLTPVYKTIFNLFILRRLSHEQISKMLGISIGTSKSNLSKARRQLQKILIHL